MRQKRLPPREDEGRRAPSHAAAASDDDDASSGASGGAGGASGERLRPPVLTEPHSTAEEYVALASGLAVLVALILACVGLGKVSWKIERKRNGLPWYGESFGVVRAHIAGQTHYLETMGLVWPVYTSSRCALGFTIIGLFVSLYALMVTNSFVRNNRGSIVRVLIVSVLTSTWYLWAIMLYPCLFPYTPFKGDMFYLQAGANFTAYASGGAGSEALLGAQQGVQLQLASTGFDELRVQQAWEQQEMPWSPSEQLSSPPVPLELSLLSTLTDSAQEAQQPSEQHPQPLAHDPHPALRHAFRSLASSTDTSGVPDFPSPADPNNGNSGNGASGSGSGSGGSFRDPYAAVPTAEEITRMQFYAKTAYEHIHSEWTLGKGYWLVLSSSLITLFFPVCYTLFSLGAWLWDRHKAAEVQFPLAIPFVALAWAAWMLGVIGFASRYWRYAVDAPSEFHFGLDQFIWAGSRHTINSWRFPARGRVIGSASGGALALGVMGIISGWATAASAVYHIYDRARSPLLVGVLSTLTSTLWTVALIGYGASMPHYLQGMYFEIGYSFWIVLAGAIVFSLPLLSAIAFLIYARAVRTTREERIMAIPTSLALLGLIFSLAAVGSDSWAELLGKREWEHLGLLRGRFQGDWMEAVPLAHASDPRVLRAGVASLVLLLCAILVQAPAALMGIWHVRGLHASCGGKQMPLLACALSLSATLLYALTAAAYAELMPWNALPPGYTMAHSWRALICAAVWSAMSTAGFAYLAEPPAPGEENILAAAIPQGMGGGKV